MRRLALSTVLVVLVGCLGSSGCSDGEPKPQPVVHEPAPAPEPTPLPVPAEVGDFVVVSTITFVGANAAPHQLRVVYQDKDLCRWELSRLNDEDGDRMIDYRFHGRAFKLPQDEVLSIEYSPTETQQVFARMALRREALTDDPTRPDAAAWETRELGEGLGSAKRTQDEAGHFVYTHFTAKGQPGEALTVLERFETAGRSWPKQLGLRVGPTEVWSESIDRIQTQSWFGEAYFVPPDRSTELSPK